MPIDRSLFFLIIFLVSTDAAFPAQLQNLELDDLTSLWEKFPSIINKIKEAVNRFRCPKGWRRLGGSCYYLSNLTSNAAEANETCHALHSNQSNLMQIRNTVELFYAAHVLTKYNLSALMIELDPTLLKGKTIAELLMDNQGRWQRMKEKFRDLRTKYHRVKEKIIDELNSAGLKISRRSKKIQQKARQRFDSPSIYHDYELIPPEDQTTVDNKSIVEYEYDDFETTDETDEFEHLDEISGICDQIDWNVLNNQTNIYMLTTYLINDKIVCSISDLEFDLEYDHLCEYVLDFCFANVVCGEHGHCVNTLSGFKCSCGFLYGGLLCERISRQGYQIIIGAIIVVILYSLSFKPVRWLIWKIYCGLIFLCKRKCQAAKQRKQLEDDKKKLMLKKISENDDNDDGDDDNEINNRQDENDLIPPPLPRRETIAEEFIEFLLPRTIHPLTKPDEYRLGRLLWVGGLSIFFLATLFIVTTTIHFTSFHYDADDDTKIETIANETARLVLRCEKISDYKKGNLIFFPVASALILIFSWSVKREKKCLKLFDGRPGILAPIEPFRTSNRFTTATVFGILAFEILKIFEELLFSTADPINHGILIELLFRIVVVILVGLRYYPILASLQLRNIVSRFFVCLYILADMTYAIIREGSCMGFIPLSQYYSAAEEAKLRLELGTWFIIYGLIKNTPHFIFLSYIAAELFVRFGYDSIFVPLKTGRTIWSAEMVQTDEFSFAKFYVKKLFRKSLRTYRKKIKISLKIDQENLVDHEHEENLRKKQQIKQSRVQWFFQQIYKWDDDFRFTTMATCTYTVALVFLYYLACTFVFLYISRTTGHFSFLRYYVESLLNIEIKGIFSLRFEIIFSAIATLLLYTLQIFFGIRSYKRHRLQLYQGIYVEVPSPENFKANSIAAKSVHYSGFLVGYMAWGFVICFHLIFFVTSAVRIVALRIRYVEFILAITVPVLVVYLIKMVGTSSAGKSLFIQDTDDQLNLKNRKVYAIFVYFNFFADCFLGIASCIIRLIKATFLNVVYMARLDCSFLGRPLEKFDLGYAAYVSYLHMEVAHTNPIMLAFCYSMFEDAVSRREKKGYDDECCIGPHELDDDDETIDDQITPKSDRKTKPISPTIVEEKEEKKSGSKASSPSRTSTVARLVPENKPRLPPVEPTPKTKPSDDDDDDDDNEDDDGGVKPPTISTVARLIPNEQPRLLPIQGSSDVPPPVPRREDIDDNDGDDDGGIDPKDIARQKRELEEKKKKKEDDKKKKQAAIDRARAKDDDGDGDGGIDPKEIARQKRELEEKKKKKKQTSADRNRVQNDDGDDGGIDPKEIARQKRELEEKKRKKEDDKKKKQAAVDRARAQDGDDDDGGVKKDKSKDKKTKKDVKPAVPRRQDVADNDDDDEDGGVSQQKKLAEEQKKKAAAEAKKQKKQKKSKPNFDDENDDGVPLRPASPVRPKASASKKKSTKVAPQKEDDVDDDGGRIVKSFDTIKTIIPKKAPALDHQTEKKKDTSPEVLDDGSMLTSGPARRTVSPVKSSTYDTVGQIVPKLSKEVLQASIVRTSSPPKRTESHYDTIPTEEERAARMTYASYSPPSYDQASDLALLRTVSYREAQQSTPPITQRRSTTVSLSNRSQSNTNEDSSHYSEIILPTDGNQGIVNRSYSTTNGSNHSSKLSSQQGSREETVQEETEDTDVESEAEDEEEEEEEEEEIEEEVRKEKPRERSPTPNISTANSTIAHLVKWNEAKEKERVRRKKQAKFRWFLAYTILNNYHLFDLRKHAQSRLASLRINRSNILDEEKQLTGQIPPTVTVSAPSEASTFVRQRKAPSTTSDLRSRAAAAPTPTVQRLIVPGPLIDEFPQSPAERYISIRSCMLYDVNGQPTSLSRSEGLSPAPSVTSQSAPSQKRSVGFSTRPLLEREISPTTATNANGTPIFQAVPDSVQSTADYPMTNASSVTNRSTLRAQMSHAQHMQAWRQQKMRKIQKKQPHCYFYGTPGQRGPDEKVAAAAILTPQVIVTTPSQFVSPDGQRLPSPSPFFHRPTPIQTINETKKSKTTRTTSSPDKDERSTNAGRALIHEKDTDSHRSNMTEV